MSLINIIQNPALPIREPGFYAISAQDYHADPVWIPSLSASIAKTLVLKTPRHAWQRHPRFCPEIEEDEDSAASATGSVLHEYMLGKGGGFEVLVYDDYRTKAARIAKAEAIAKGKTPILEHQFSSIVELARSIDEGILSMEDCSDFYDQSIGSEIVMVWQDPTSGVWCRAMIDRLTARGIVYDLKTTNAGIDTAVLQRKFEDGFAIQPAFYLRGLETLVPQMAGRLRWRWIFAEQTAPFAVRVEEAGRFALKLGGEQIDQAMRLWAHCTETSQWPGYAPKVGTLDPTEWTYNRWSDRALVLQSDALIATADPLAVAAE